MQTTNSNINDMFSGTGSYPLENLSKTNRWVRLADALEWKTIEERYNERLNNHDRGAGNKPARMVIGAMIIKHMLRASDQVTIDHIQENPYMQYLVGLKYFREEPVFTPELFVYLRKRIDEGFFNEVMLSIHKDCIKKAESQKTDKGADDDNGGTSDSTTGQRQPVTHKGKMKIDATCTDAEVRYPTDINILEDASREVERLLQKLCDKAGVSKPKSGRGDARSCFVKYLKRKSKGRKLVRSTKKLLLSKDLQRLMATIGTLASDTLHCLNRTDLRNLAAIRTAYVQQKGMYDNDVHSCMNRIISIFQSHVRPIVRGKAGRKTEYGAKIGVSVVNGFTYIDHLSWEAYNESSDLKLQLETYKSRYGYYPREVQADKIYLGRENRRLLKDLGIGCHCPALGRPPKNPSREEETLRRKASAERNGVEAAFGTAKRVYGAKDIRAKLPETARTWIGACFFVRNLKKFLQGLLWLFPEIMRKFWLFFGFQTNGDPICTLYVIRGINRKQII